MHHLLGSQCLVAWLSIDFNSSAFGGGGNLQEEKGWETPDHKKIPSKLAFHTTFNASSIKGIVSVLLPQQVIRKDISSESQTKLVEVCFPLFK